MWENENQVVMQVEILQQSKRAIVLRPLKIVGDLVNHKCYVNVMYMYKKEIPPRDLLDKYRIIIHGIIFNIGEAGIVKVKATNNVTWPIYSLSLINNVYYYCATMICVNLNHMHVYTQQPSKYLNREACMVCIIVYHCFIHKCELHRDNKFAIENYIT